MEKGRIIRKTKYAVSIRTTTVLACKTADRQRPTPRTEGVSIESGLLTLMHNTFMEDYQGRRPPECESIHQAPIGREYFQAANITSSNATQFSKASV
jgi:hypothetical protein